MIGRIYRIVHLESELCYIGSTTNELRWRWQGHCSAYKQWLKNKAAEVAIFQYFKQYGLDKFKMILIKEYDVVDRKHLQAYETLWIAKFRKVSTNKNNGFFIKNLYYQHNRDDHIEKMKLYRKENPETIKRNNQDYYKANKERLDAKSKERLSVKFNCECGGRYSLASKSHHTKTKKHQQWLQTQQN